MANDSTSMLEGFIKAQMKELRDYHTKLELAAKHLTPFVLRHFNEYVDDVINPKMPEGYALAKSEFAHLSSFCGEPGFSITTGPLITPQGLWEGVFFGERLIMDLCHAYENNTPWVNSIDYGFEISK